MIEEGVDGSGFSLTHPAYQPVDELHEDYDPVYGPFLANSPENGVPYRAGYLGGFVRMHDGDQEF